MPKTRKFSEPMEPIMRDPVAGLTFRRAMDDALLIAEIRERHADDPFDSSRPRHDIGRVVSKDDIYLWALREHVEALGGEPEVTAKFPDGETIKIA